MADKVLDVSSGRSMIKLLWRSVRCSHTGTLHNKAMSAARIKRSCDRKLLEAAAGGKGWGGG